MQDPLIKIANLVKSAREEQKMSVEDLADLSRVSVKHIINIEALNHQSLPETAFLIGFLQKIFKALKLKNGSELIEEFRQDSGNYIVQTIVDELSPDTISLNSSVNNFSSFKQKPFVIALVAILVLILLFIFFGQLKGKESSKTTPETVKKTLSVKKEKIKKPVAEPKVEKKEVKNEEEPKQEATTPLKKESNKKLEGKKLEAGSGSVHLKIKIKDTAWFQVIGVGASRILHEGDVFVDRGLQKFEFYDERGFILATGNAAAFQVTTKDGSFLLGKQGELIKWYYPQSLQSNKSSSYKQQKLTF